MTDEKDEERENLPELPDKLSQRIERHRTDFESGDFIVGDGKHELNSKHPVAVVEYFLAVHASEWADWTFRDYSYDLTRFLEYCAYAGQDDLSKLSSRELESFKQWRKRDGNIGLASLHGQLANIRVFIRFCERIDVVEEGLADDMEMPELQPSDIVSHVRIDADEVEQILEYHGQNHYVTRAHAEFALMWTSLCRLGCCRSLDLENYNREEGYVEFTHDPETGTPLKNGESEVEGEGGERQVNLPDWVCELLNTYIDGTGDPNDPKRIETEDGYGRKPLFTTSNGRVSESTIRRDLYRLTQPCQYGQDCPHDMDISECEARINNNLLSQCPSCVSPHPVRRGGICHQLKQGVPKDLICEKADVSRKVLNKHYDIRTKEEARIQRRNELRKHLDGFDESVEEYHDKPSFVERELPVVADITAATLQIDRSIRRISSDSSSQTRLVKGLVGYATFVSLLGINLGLMGIGFNPVTMEIIINLG